MADQLSLRGVIMKLGLQLDGTLQSNMNPMWDYLLVIEDPVTEENDTFKCDDVHTGDNAIHLHMGDQINI